MSELRVKINYIHLAQWCKSMEWHLNSIRGNSFQVEMAKYYLDKIKQELDDAIIRNGLEGRLMDKKKISVVVLFSVIAGALYRMGGYGPPFNTKFRDCGIPSCVAGLLWILGFHSWWLVPVWLMVFGAQTTYFKKKGTDAKWYNWTFVGLAFSLSTIIIPIVTGHWMGFLYRSIIVTAFTPIWSELIGWDDLEEGGRGIIQLATVPLLFI